MLKIYEEQMNVGRFFFRYGTTFSIFMNRNKHQKAVGCELYAEFSP